MPLTLHAQVPFPEQADTDQPMDIVLPRRENAQLYDALAQLADGMRKRLTSKAGVTVMVEEIRDHPGVHEKMNALLRAKEMIEVTRRGAELLLTDFEPKPEIEEKEHTESMADVLSAMRDEKPAVQAPAGDTMVNMNTGDTKPIKPQTGPRKLSAEDWAKVKGPQPTDAAVAADIMMRKKMNRG